MLMIRDGVWLILLGGMAIVWYADHGVSAAKIKALKAYAELQQTSLKNANRVAEDAMRQAEVRKAQN
jgi:hypothetical protein